MFDSRLRRVGEKMKTEITKKDFKRVTKEMVLIVKYSGLDYFEAMAFPSDYPDLFKKIAEDLLKK